MLRFRIGSNYFELGAKAKLRLERKSPLISPEVISGEYTYPFTLLLTDEIKLALDYKTELNAEGFYDGEIEAFLYDDDTVIHKGLLKVAQNSESQIDFNFKVNSSRLTKIADKKLKEIDFGSINAKSHKQSIEWHVSNDFTGRTLSLIFGDTTITEDMSPTVADGLINLEMAVNGSMYNGSYTVVATVTGSNYIKFEADWFGVEPELVAFVNTVGMATPIPTANIVAIKTIKDVFNDEWANLMNSGKGNLYPDVGYTFFPILNTESGLYHQNDVALGLFPFFYQNFYSARFDTFVPAAAYEYATGLYSFPSCVTPFMFLPYMMDKIMSSNGMKIEGYIHDSLFLKRLCIWSNYYIDGKNSNLNSFSIYSDYEDLNKCVPDITVGEFLGLIKDSLGVGFLIDEEDKVIVKDLNEILSSDDVLQVVDLSDFELSDKIQYPGPEFNDLSITTEFDSGDKLYDAANDKKEAMIFIGSYNTFADLPETPTPYNLPPKFYTLVKDEMAFYMRKYNSGTFLNEWVPLEGLTPDYNVDSIADRLLSITVFDTLEMKRELPAIDPDSDEWVIPEIKYPMSHYLQNGHNSPCKLRLMYYAGMVDGESYEYPLGTSNGFTYNNDDLGVSTRYTTERGLYKTRIKTWTDFLRKSKQIEKYFNLTDFEIRQLKFDKLIYSNGTRYLLEGIQAEYPITKPTLLKLRKIEVHG